MTGLLDEADRVRSEIYRILQGEYPDDPKTMIVVGWLDLAMEHHQAIIQLIRIKLHGPAFALVRGVCEIMFKAHWVGRCATPEQVERIARKDDFEFPKTREMTKAIDAAFQADSYFTTIKKAAWKPMNSYTHAGLLQLAKRFSNGKVEPRYPEEEVEKAVNCTTAAILTTAYLLAFLTNREKERDEIDALMVKFADGECTSTAS